MRIGPNPHDEIGSVDCFDAPGRNPEVLGQATLQEAYGNQKFLVQHFPWCGQGKKILFHIAGARGEISYGLGVGLGN
jgi:hypothetical protein